MLLFQPTAAKAMEIWAQHVMRYSRRDQLSINLALHKPFCVTPSPLDIDNHESPPFTAGLT